jgi:glutamate formiminotransferase / formiminotetrahydrofolate cyclodeaminase
VAFDEVCRAAGMRGVRVTGSELVGLVPLQTMLDAGRHFLAKQQRSLGVSEEELVRLAIVSLGLDELAPFKPEERIIEYRLRNRAGGRLVQMTVRDFTDETASESAAPGGGSVAALLGALAAALGAMVANLSAHKRGWDDQWEQFSDWAVQGQRLKDELLRLVDEDTLAFERVMSALGMPKGTPAEKSARSEALARANLGALEVPWQVMQASAAAFDLLLAMAQRGNPASASDAGVGAICARAAVRGAWLNVQTNASGVKDAAALERIMAAGAALEHDAAAREAAILAVVQSKFT